MTPSHENVLAMLDRAPSHALEQGMEWYYLARNEAMSLDSRFHRSAAIIAALSPMAQWDTNKLAARRIYDLNGNVVFNPDGSNGIGLGDNVRKAVRIYRGEDAMDVLGGRKVRSFYLTILDPQGNVPPVIDRHAFDIAIGKRTSPETKSILSRKGVYDAFVKAYVDAAAIAGMGNAEIQAVTWVTFKHIHGLK